jgi:hypothetical protein
MKQTFSRFLFVVGFAVLSIPSATHAYFTTDQQAVRLTEQHLLYTVSYTFGFANRELYMPILATEGQGFDADVRNRVGYELVSGESATELGMTTSIVLTKDEAVEVRDKQYYLPAGESATFTLVTIVTLPEDTPAVFANIDDLALHITHLPFTMVTEEGNTISAQLNPSELRYYQTSSIDLLTSTPVALPQAVQTLHDLPLK